MTTDDHGHSKERQASFFDHEAATEFEIDRPRHTPKLYRQLIRDKYRKSVRGIEDELRGATILVVCGGSGMDSESLALDGARVVCSDLSLGAALRAKERASRRGIPLFPVVADAEALPFADRSLDFTYVHDGLHHLEAPQLAVREMCRVAATGISITEPAEAVATQIAVRLGLAQEQEESGNDVARQNLTQLSRTISECGLDIVTSSRYAMYYRHHPGSVMALLSMPLLFELTRGVIALANMLIGRWGNKLAVVAIRKTS